MLISIITPTFNSSKTLEANIESVVGQSYQNVEQIFIDGRSHDNTLQIIQDLTKHQKTVVSEPDMGLYFALNKGMRLVNGDIVGILNSDDQYANNFILQQVNDIFSNNKIDFLYFDLVYQHPNKNKVTRHWSAGKFNSRKLKFGWMPPHPTVFFRKELLSSVVNFNTIYRISSDYDWLLRTLSNCKLKVFYVPKVAVRMAPGGISNQSLNSIIMKTKEDYRILKAHGYNPFIGVLCKNLRKLSQLL